MRALRKRGRGRAIAYRERGRFTDPPPTAQLTRDGQGGTANDPVEVPIDVIKLVGLPPVDVLWPETHEGQSALFGVILVQDLPRGLLHRGRLGNRELRFVRGRLFFVFGSR
jgi:hypothetical protein